MNQDLQESFGFVESERDAISLRLRRRASASARTWAFRLGVFGSIAAISLAFFWTLKARVPGTVTAAEVRPKPRRFEVARRRPAAEGPGPRGGPEPRGEDAPRAPVRVAVDLAAADKDDAQVRLPDDSGRLGADPGPKAEAGRDRAREAGPDPAAGPPLSPPEQVLRAKGFVRVQDMLLLEEERLVQQKMRAYEEAYRNFKVAEASCDAIVQAETQLDLLWQAHAQTTVDINEYQTRKDSVDRNMNTQMMKIWNDAHAGQIRSRDARTGIEREINSTKAQLPTMQRRQEAGARYDQGLNALINSIDEAKYVIDPTMKRYFEIEKDAEVRKALADLKKSTSTPLGRGPSYSLREAVRIIHGQEAVRLLKRKKPTLR